MAVPSDATDPPGTHTGSALNSLHPPHQSPPALPPGCTTLGRCRHICNSSTMQQSDWCGHICKHHTITITTHHHHYNYSTTSESLITGNSCEVPSVASCPCISAQHFKTYLDRIHTQIHKRINCLSLTLCNKKANIPSWQMLKKCAFISLQGI